MISKISLARFYFPDRSDKVALSALEYLIKSKPVLFCHLRKQGYHKQRDYFTVREMRLIFAFLGVPLGTPQIDKVFTSAAPMCDRCSAAEMFNDK